MTVPDDTPIKATVPGGAPIKIEAPAFVVAPKAAAPSAQVGDRNIAPTTTAAGDLVTAGQRRVNLIWESTQATVAVIVTASTLFVAGRLAVKEGGDQAAFLLLSNVFFMVVSTYFARTNHTKTGGVKSDDTGR